VDKKAESESYSEGERKERQDVNQYKSCFRHINLNCHNTIADTKLSKQKRIPKGTHAIVGHIHLTKPIMRKNNVSIDEMAAHGIRKCGI
ncbi:MAG: hypothetical protein IKP27_01800, partial [Paludibacteraceae bacterium]|nr:hypothetical protein [Paludibacteraceae bacterium]